MPPHQPTYHLHIDPFSGIAGDMFLGALIDMGVSLDDLRAALAPLQLADPYEIQTQHVQRCGIGGTDLRVITTPPPTTTDITTTSATHRSSP